MLTTEKGEFEFDLVIDTRGLGAKGEVPALRGVRGEVIRVRAPEVSLKHMIRLMHPRYALYIVPRPNHVFVVGATSIESEDTSPVSVRSALELLSALYSVHSGFAEARILDMRTEARPALMDNLPRLFVQKGLIHINGLYRHGYLQGPAMVEVMMEYIENGSDQTIYPELITLEAYHG